MKSFVTADFWKAYAQLSPEIKEQARKAYQLWKDNSLQPSLHFKKVGRKVWSARISGRYRALALKEGDCPDSPLWGFNPAIAILPCGIPKSCSKHSTNRSSFLDNNWGVRLSAT